MGAAFKHDAIAGTATGEDSTSLFPLAGAEAGSLAGRQGESGQQIAVSASMEPHCLHRAQGAAAGVSTIPKSSPPMSPGLHEHQHRSAAVMRPPLQRSASDCSLYSRAGARSRSGARIPSRSSHWMGHSSTPTAAAAGGESKAFSRPPNGSVPRQSFRRTMTSRQRARHVSQASRLRQVGGGVASPPLVAGTAPDSPPRGHLAGPPPSRA